MIESDPGLRLTRQTAWLELLCSHLMGPTIRARIELEDLVQEVFLRALADPGGPPAEEEGEPALRRYLARLARNSVFDLLRYLRTNKRRARELPIVHADWSGSGVAASRLAASLPGPGTQAAEREQRRALLERYDRLPPEHQRVLGLRQFEGLSARETARRMGRSESAIHSLFRREGVCQTLDLGSGRRPAGGRVVRPIPAVAVEPPAVGSHAGEPRAQREHHQGE